MIQRLSLEGEYQIDVYKGDGTLRYSIGPAKNFITSTGLSMPLNYAFADCFRYLSLGVGGSTPNSLTSNGGLGTINLASPLPKFMYMGSRSDPNSPSTVYVNAGFTEYKNTVKLSRGWRVPPNSTFDNAYTFSEFMLSPGQPALTGFSNAGQYTSYTPTSPVTSNYVNCATAGWTPSQWIGYAVLCYDVSNNLLQNRTIYGNTATQLQVTPNWVGTFTPNYFYITPYYSLCHCSETDTEIRNGTAVQGPDGAATAYEYGPNGRKTPICSQTGAFARVVNKSISVHYGDYLILNYSLNIKVDSGLNRFCLKGLQMTRNRTLSNDINNWANSTNGVSGFTTLVHHGLKLINPGSFTANAPWGYPMTQPANAFGGNYDVTNDYGESFVSAWGCPLEPYCSTDCLSAYLTTDNLQFLVNAHDGGAAQTYASGNSGLMMFRTNPYNDANPSFPAYLYNVRQPDSTNQSVNQMPNPANYQTSDTPANYSFDESFAVTNAIQVLPNNYTKSWRMRSINRNFQWWGPVQSSFSFGTYAGEQIRNVVLSYVSKDYVGYHIPYMDIGFSDSGYHMCPRTGYYNGIYEPPPAHYVFDVGDNGNGTVPKWNYLEPNATLTLQFQILWGAACDPTVVGC